MGAAQPAVPLITAPRLGVAGGALVVARRLARTIILAALSLAVIIGLWYAVIKIFHLNAYFAKSPLDVWRYVTSDPEAAANRRELWSNLGVTLRDAGLGFLVGTIVALFVAMIFVLRRTVAQTFMPVAIALRSIPLIALTPLIVLVFGRGLVGVTVISGIVTFFPTLVNSMYGLRSVPREALDLMHVYGAAPVTTLRKVQLPSAIPALFASARIAAPLALLGGILAEWLATGNGLGYLMLEAVIQSRFTTLWAAVVLLTSIAVLIYNLVMLLEVPMLTRYTPGQAHLGTLA
jgi:ABC-type nitrate/sulfonate/bicarbonate transport system permease component